MRRLALCGFALAAACGHKPSISSFTADKTAIVAGDPVVLSWQVLNATRVEIDNGVGVVTGTSTTVQPLDNTTYTLTASDNGSSPATKTVHIDVAPAPRPIVITSFTATPPQIAAGDTVLLQWATQGDVTSQQINGQNVPVGTNQLAVTPAVTTSYTLTLTGSARFQPKPITLVVRVGPRPAIASFTASPTTSSQGDDVTLMWKAANATSYSVADDKGHTFFAGPLTSLVVQPTANTTYTLTATGPAGTATATATVAVTQTTPTTFTYVPPTPGAGDVVQLVAQPCAPCTTIRFELRTIGAVTADALALDLPVPGAVRVALHQTAGSADFAVNTAALKPGTNPPAQAIALPTSGPLARVLTIGIAQKPAGSGAVTTPASIPANTVIASFALDLVPAGGTGVVFNGSGGATFTLRNGPGGTTLGTFAAGKLTVN